MTNTLNGLAILSLVYASGATVAEAQGAPRDKWVSEQGYRPVDECNGFLYRAKRKEVPVYDTADTSAARVQKLKLGERVCYVGEQGTFAILQWRLGEGEAEQSKLAYARLVDLWEPRDKPRSTDAVAGFFQRAKEYLYYMFYGGVPESPLLPYPTRTDVPEKQADDLSRRDETLGECALDEALASSCVEAEL